MGLLSERWDGVPGRLADADGSNAKQIQPGLRFHLMPSWSPDGAWVLFVAGEHYDCHPHVIKADGAGLKKLASRNGYRGVIDYLDVYDFHDGSSDLPVWAPNSKSVFYTSKVGSNVELFRVGHPHSVRRTDDTAAADATAIVIQPTCFTVRHDALSFER
jgi:TolB protein